MTHAAVFIGEATAEAEKPGASVVWPDLGVRASRAGQW